MKLLDILKAIRQEEICDEMITTYDEENKLINETQKILKKILTMSKVK